MKMENVWIVTIIVWLISGEWVSGAPVWKETKLCPQGRKEWIKEAERLCEENPSTFHCLYDTNGTLVETCILPDRIFTGGCPLINFVGDQPGILARTSDCPIENKGCPHSSTFYYTNETFKFPACYGQKMNGSFANETNSSSSDNDVDGDTDFGIRIPGTSSRIVGIVVSVVVVVGLVIAGIICRKWRVHSRMKDSCNIKLQAETEETMVDDKSPERRDLLQPEDATVAVSFHDEIDKKETGDNDEEMDSCNIKPQAETGETMVDDKSAERRDLLQPEDRPSKRSLKERRDKEEVIVIGQGKRRSYLIKNRFGKNTSNDDEEEFGFPQPEDYLFNGSLKFETDRILKKMPIGTFLVRNSGSEENSKVISLSYAVDETKECKCLEDEIPTTIRELYEQGVITRGYRAVQREQEKTGCSQTKLD